MLPAGEETQQKGVMTESDIKKKSKDIEKADNRTAGIPEELMEVEEDEELVEEKKQRIGFDEIQVMFLFSAAFRQSRN